MWMEELSNGKFKYFERYNDPYTEKNKRVSVTLTSKSNQAKKQAQSLLNDKINQKSLNQKNKSVTFKDCFDEWFEVYSQTVKPTSSIKVRYSMKHISKYIKDDYLIDKIGKSTIQDMLNDLYYKEEYSFNYVNSIKATVSLIFSFAENANYINVNPVLKTVLKQKPKTVSELESTRNKFLEQKELSLLLAEIRKSEKSKRNADICEFIALTGLRIGELLSLKTSHFNGHSISIEGTLNYTTQKYSEGIIGTTKTDESTRVVELSNRAIEIIENSITENTLRSLSKSYNDRGFIFTSHSGSPVAIQTINACTKSNALRIGLDKTVTTHVFRHTHVSLLSELNIPIKTIMERVGHSDYETTLKIYTHVTSKMKETVIDKLNSLEFNAP